MDNNVRHIAIKVAAVFVFVLLTVNVVGADYYYNINNVLVLTDDVASPYDNLYRSWSYSQNTSFYRMKTQFRFWEFYSIPGDTGYRCIHRHKVKCSSCTGTFSSPAVLPHILLPPPPPGGDQDTWRSAQHKSKRFSTSSNVVNYTSVGGHASSFIEYGNHLVDYYGQCPNFEG